MSPMLAHVHENGIIHRDKPDNLVLSPTGVWLLDFGIARALLQPGRRRAGTEVHHGDAGVHESRAPHRARIEDARPTCFPWDACSTRCCRPPPRFRNGLRDAMKARAVLPIDMTPLPKLPDEVTGLLRRSVAPTRRTVS
jgi:serine/threonine protein kinase